MNKKNVIIALVFVWLGHFLVDFMIGVWPVYKTMMQMDLAKVGVMTAVSVLIGEALQLVFGSLCDSGYRKQVFIAGILASCCGALYSYFIDYQALFFLLLVVCIGSGAFHPAAASIAGALSKDRKGLFLTIFASGGALGMAASQIVFSRSYLFLEGNTGWLMIPPLLLVAIVIMTAMAGTTSVHQEKNPITAKSLKRFFSHPPLRYLYALQVANQTVIWATIFLLPDILSYRGYDSWVSLGGAHLFFVLGSATMMVPAGYLADKYSCRAVIFIGSLSGLVFLYSFILLPSVPVFLVLGLLFFSGASMGMVSPVSIAFGNRMLPKQPGLVSATLMGLAWCFSEAIGQGGGGLISTYFEDDPAGKALSILALVLVVSIVAAAKLPEQVVEHLLEPLKEKEQR